jgi:hypothetical protein
MLPSWRRVKVVVTFHPDFEIEGMVMAIAGINFHRQIVHPATTKLRIVLCGGVNEREPSLTTMDFIVGAKYR